jgi:MinD superfamily P-loop ATPase
MRIAIASGKGGTGKTTVATNLAWVAARRGRAVAYLDCDVEEPNGRIFLRPEIDNDRPIEKLVPVVDPALCTHCGACARICRYGAIASLPSQTLVFADLCHACGGCVLVCPVDAIREEPRPIGRLRVGRSGEIHFVEGVLDVGEAMSPPAIRAVKTAVPEVDLALLDAPPGTSCPVVETVRGSDYVLLVAEPTPFGRHDLMLAVEMVRALKVPLGVVLNRAGAGDGKVREYCTSRRVPVLAELADDRAVAEAYSRGEMIADVVPGCAEGFARLLDRLDEATRRGAT